MIITYNENMRIVQKYLVIISRDVMFYKSYYERWGRFLSQLLFNEEGETVKGSKKVGRNEVFYVMLVTGQ